MNALCVSMNARAAVKWAVDCCSLIFLRLSQSNCLFWASEAFSPAYRALFMPGLLSRAWTDSPESSASTGKGVV